MTDDFFCNRMPWQEIEASPHGPQPPQGLRGGCAARGACAAGYNIRWLLRMIVKKGLGLLLCLLQACGLAGMLEKLAEIIGLKRLQNSDQRWALA